MLSQQRKPTPEAPQSGEDTVYGQREQHTVQAHPESSAQELLGNQLGPRGRREEVRIGYFVVSLVNRLCGHILCPSSPSRVSAAWHTGHIPNNRPLPLANSLGTLPTKLNVRTLASQEWILRETVRQRIQNKRRGQTPGSPFLSFGMLCSVKQPPDKNFFLLFGAKTGHGESSTTELYIPGP